MDDKRLFVNTTPGNRFLDRLTGKTKVRTFLILIVLLIATWDIRVILPFFILSWIALISLKPDWKKVWGVMAFCGSDEPFQPFPCMGGQAGLWAEYMRRFYGYF